MPHASWPLCCSSDKPSQISGAASLVGSCNSKPRIPHTEGKINDGLQVGNRAYSWKESRLAQDCLVANDKEIHWESILAIIHILFQSHTSSFTTRLNAIYYATLCLSKRTAIIKQEVTDIQAVCDVNGIGQMLYAVKNVWKDELPISTSH